MLPPQNTLAICMQIELFVTVYVALLGLFNGGSFAPNDERILGIILTVTTTFCLLFGLAIVAVAMCKLNHHEPWAAAVRRSLSMAGPASVPDSGMGVELMDQPNPSTVGDLEMGGSSAAESPSEIAKRLNAENSSLKQENNRDEAETRRVDFLRQEIDRLKAENQNVQQNNKDLKLREENTFLRQENDRLEADNQKVQEHLKQVQLHFEKDIEQLQNEKEKEQTERLSLQLRLEKDIERLKHEVKVLHLSSTLNQPGGGGESQDEAVTPVTTVEEALVEPPVSAEDIELQATTEPQSKSIAAKASTSDHSKTTEGPTKWKKVHDDASGEVYYYNSETRKTTWDREPQRPTAISCKTSNPFCTTGGMEGDY